MPDLGDFLREDDERRLKETREQMAREAADPEYQRKMKERSEQLWREMDAAAQRQALEPPDEEDEGDDDDES
jgi:hypothetical protein